LITLAQRWLLALAAVTNEVSGRSHVRLGGALPTPAGKALCVNDLAANWSVDCAEGSRDALAFLTSTGFRSESDLLNEHRAKPLRATRQSTPDARLHPKGGLLAYDAGLLSLLAGWSFGAGHVTEDEAFAAIRRLAVEVQAAYTSFTEFGYHALLGRALRTGAWDVERERIVQILLASEISPWRALPWDQDLAGDACLLEGRTKISAIDLTASFVCPRCSAYAPVSSIQPEQHCPGCAKSFEVPLEAWADVLADDTVEKVHNYPLGAEHRLRSFGRTYAGTSRWLRSDVACLACGDALTADALLAACREPRTCAKCTAPLRARSSDALLHAAHPEVLAVLGERPLRSAVPRSRAATFAVACISCGAPLAPDGSKRVISCAHCKGSQELSDEAWRIVSPAPAAPRLRLVLATLSDQRVEKEREKPAASTRGSGDGGSTQW
jgi:hypothetical protein